MNYLSKIYEDLKEDFSLDTYKNSLSLSRSITLENGIEVIVYLIRQGWYRQVAIILDENDDKISIPNINGIAFEYQEFISNQDVISCLTMSQSNDDSILFDIVVNNIIQELKKLKLKSKKNEAIKNCVIKWRQFFKSNNEIIISENKQQGLFSELVLLEKMIIKYGPKAVFSWTGCEKEQHDFYIGNNAIEVKSSSKRQPYQIEISSEYQLDKGDVAGDLLLYSLFVKKSKADGENICDIIHRIEGLLQGEISCLNEFKNKLFLVGYLEDESEVYKHYFRKRDEKIFNVTDDFPCISRRNIMIGISHVKYSLSVDKCEGFEISEEEFWAKLGGGN